ncbi:MAG: TolC family protein [Novosphingobium sp.]
MKRNVLAKFAVLLLVSTASGHATAERFSLPEFVKEAVQRSPELGKAQARADAAEAVRDQAKREWLPKVEISGAVGRRHLENNARIAAGISAIDQSPLYGAISVEQPVLDFGRRSSEIKAQSANLDAALADEAYVRQEVTLSLARTYIFVAMQQELVKSTRENVSFHESTVADIEASLKNGILSIAELQQATERLQSARVQLTQAEVDLAAAQAEMSLHLGREVGAVDLAEAPSARSVMPANIDEVLSTAEKVDPSIKAASKRLDAASSGTSRARRERLPTVSLQGSYRRGRDFDGFRGESKEANGLLMMRWPLFDGGVSIARVREADAKEEEAAFDLTRAQRDSAIRARSGWLRLQAWRKRLAELESRKSVAAALLDSYRQQFGIGRRSLLDLLDAQASLNAAATEASTARAGGLLAEYALLAQLQQLNAFLAVNPDRVDASVFGPR